MTSDGLATVPIEAYRNGDFSSAPFAVINEPPDPLGRVFPTGTIFDPSTTRPAPNGQIIRDPFPGNKIPLSEADLVFLKLQSLIPLPNLPGVVNNYAIPAYGNFRHTTIPSIKMDHVVNSNIKVFGYFSVTHTTSPNSNGFPAALAPVAPQDDTSYTTRIN